jgi:glycosyltransferase involved in cell wall biosynthesis
MAQGLPVVALDHQGASDILPDDASIKVPVGDAEETADRLARAIAMLAANPEMRASMSRAARDFAQRSTWESRVTEVYEELQMILAGKRNASPS